jgi:hypothetical protein
MPDVPSDVAPSPLGTAEAIQPLWEQFRKGGVAPCPNDGGPAQSAGSPEKGPEHRMALNVDGLGGAYRFVCVQCGMASPWFEAKFAHLVLRGTIGPEAVQGEE